jgi:hypothetical protein
MNQVLENACNGKSYSQGGLNVDQFKIALKQLLPNLENEINKAGRAELHKICQENLLVVKKISVPSAIPKKIPILKKKQQILPKKKLAGPFMPEEYHNYMEYSVPIIFKSPKKFEKPITFFAKNSPTKLSPIKESQLAIDLIAMPDHIFADTIKNQELSEISKLLQSSKQVQNRFNIPMIREVLNDMLDKSDLDDLLHFCYSTSLCDDKVWERRWIKKIGTPLKIIPNFNAMESYMIGMFNLSEMKDKRSGYEGRFILDSVFAYGMENIIKNYLEPQLVKSINESIVSHAFTNGHLNIIKYMKQIGRKMAEHTFGNGIITIIAAYGHLDILQYIHSIPKYDKYLKAQLNPSDELELPIKLRDIISSRRTITDTAALFSKPIEPTLRWLFSNNLIEPINQYDIESLKKYGKNDTELLAALKHLGYDF